MDILEGMDTTNPTDFKKIETLYGDKYYHWYMHFRDMQQALNAMLRKGLITREYHNHYTDKLKEFSNELELPRNVLNY